MPTAPPLEDPDDSEGTPTLPDGVPFHVLENLDEQEVAEMRSALRRLAAEASRTSDGAPKRLEALGPFRDLVEIGRGGMGRVYRTLDPESGEDVAVKVTTPALKDDPVARRRFLRETRAAQSLRHPGIVSYRGAGEDDGRCYIVSDLCDGPNLEVWLKARKPPVPAREAARIVRALADAVAHAHSRGVLHRDLKPSNVLLPGATVDSDAEILGPRLTDFGLARVLDRDAPAGETATASGQILGSPPYMAPEQAAGRGGEVDRRTDVYGLGAVLYSVLTSRPPFRGETPQETLRMVVTDDPIPVRVLRPGIPKALERITLACLEKQRTNRYESVEALRDDLDAFLDGRSIRPPRISRVERFRRWSRRRPKVTAGFAVGLGAMVIVVGAIAAWNYQLRKHVEELRRERDLSARGGYAGVIQSAEGDLKDGRLGIAQSKLATLVPTDGMPDFREFSWRYLSNASRREATLLSNDALALTKPSMSSDGRWLATGTDSSPLMIFDLDEDRALWSSGPSNEELALHSSFSPDGRFVAACFRPRDGDRSAATRYRIEVRDAGSGDVVTSRRFDSAHPLLDLHLLDDGRLILTVPTCNPVEPGETDVSVWSTRKGLPDERPPLRLPGCRAISPDGRKFAAENPERRLGVFDLDRGWLAGLPSIPVEGLSRVVFDQNAKRLAVAFERGGEVQILDLESGRLLRQPSFIVPRPTIVDAIAFHPSANILLVHCRDQEVKLINFPHSVQYQLYPPTSAPGVATNRMMFSPDGSKFFVHRSEFQAADRIEVWSTDSRGKWGESPVRVKAPMGDWFLRSSGRQELIYGLGRRVWRWDWRSTISPSTGDSLQAHGDEAWAVDYSPDGKLFATVADNDGDKSTIKIWDVATNRPVRTWEENETTVADLAFSPDGKRLATAHFSEHQALRVREVSGGDPVIFEMADGQWARSVIFHPSGEVLFAGGDRGQFAAWDLRTRMQLWSVRLGTPRAVALNQLRIHDLAVDPVRRRLASAQDDGAVRIHDIATGAVLFEYHGTASVYSLDFSPDGHTLAAADGEGSIHLLHAATGGLIRILYGDDSELRAIAFSPDGRTLAAGGLGRVVRLWDPETAHELLSLEGAEAQINSLAFSNDGCTLTAADHSGKLTFWRGPHSAH